MWVLPSRSDKACLRESQIFEENGNVGAKRDQVSAQLLVSRIHFFGPRDEVVGDFDAPFERFIDGELRPKDALTW
jgi:hypothetical protein